MLTTIHLHNIISITISPLQSPLQPGKSDLDETVYRWQNLQFTDTEGSVFDLTYFPTHNHALLPPQGPFPQPLSPQPPLIPHHSTPHVFDCPSDMEFPVQVIFTYTPPSPPGTPPIAQDTPGVELVAVTHNGTDISHLLSDETLDILEAAALQSIEDQQDPL